MGLHKSQCCSTYSKLSETQEQGEKFADSTVPINIMLFRRTRKGLTAVEEVVFIRLGD